MLHEYYLCASVVGTDVTTMERVVHIGVLYTREALFQETGRAGQNKSSATSALYFNSYDVSQRKKAL